MDELPSTSTKNDTEKNDIEKELTQKFLRGEITFADYSSEWYGRDGEDIEISAPDDRPSQFLQLRDKALNFKRRKFTRLSTALLGLMGEANIRFVRGEKEIAEKMCYEIIRQVPTAPEPYQTLAQIYENDSEKSLQFSLLAAHLSPSDANEWLRLAAISKQKNDSKQEMLCYTQAIKAEPQNLANHIKRLELLTSLENANYPVKILNVNRVKCYEKIVTSLPPTEGETIMEYAKMAASLYYNSYNIVEKALEVMSVAYKKCSSLFTLEDTNLFLELLISRKQYQTCIEVFVSNVEVDIEAEIQTVCENDVIEEQTNYLNCQIPNNLPIDLRCKLLVCFIHLRAFNLVKTLLLDFLTNDVEKAGDLYMDVEEALSAVGEHELAIQVLEPLVNNNSFDLGAVWLKHAECLYNLGREDKAIDSYLKVLKHAPQHCDARRKLFRILESRNRIDEALDVLQQDYQLAVSAQLLYEQCCALKKYNKTLKYLKVGEALLSKTFGRYRSNEEFKIARLTKSDMELIYNFRATRGEKQYNDDDIHFDEEETFKLEPAEQWELFKDLLTIAHQYKMYFVMQRLSFGALLSKPLTSKYLLEIDFYCLQACLLNNDYVNPVPFIKDFIIKYRTIPTWNLLNLIGYTAEDSVNIKYLLRQFKKHSHDVGNMFLGNNYLTSGRYAIALKYHLEYHEQFQDPLSALLIGISLLTLITQRTVQKQHHQLLLQGMSYFNKYHTLRKFDQEGYYNLGRAYQMVGLSNLALEYYEKGLACEPVAYCDTHGAIDLTKEIAYNMCQLYKDHSPVLAQNIMLKYLVI